MSRVDEVKAAAMEAMPKLKPDKEYTQRAIFELASMLEDDEQIVAIRGARVAPNRMRGTGLVVLTDRSVIFADVHPSAENRLHRIEAQSVKAVSATAQQIGVMVAIINDGPLVESLAPNQTTADEFVAQLHELAPHAVNATPAGVVEHWWDDPTIGWPRKLSLGNKWEYIGGLAAYPTSKDNLSLDLTRSGLSASKVGALLPFKVEIGWDSVAGVSVEGSQQVQNRTTVTRMLAVGLFAFAWKKKLNSGFLVLELRDGSEVVFASARHTEPQLRAALSSVLAAAKRARGSTEADDQQGNKHQTAADRIRSLAALRDEGLVTDEEFEAKRAALLDEI